MKRNVSDAPAGVRCLFRCGPATILRYPCGHAYCAQCARTYADPCVACPGPGAVRIGTFRVQPTIFDKLNLVVIRSYNTNEEAEAFAAQFQTARRLSGLLPLIVQGGCVLKPEPDIQIRRPPVRRRNTRLRCKRCRIRLHHSRIDHNGWCKLCATGA